LLSYDTHAPPEDLEGLCSFKARKTVRHSRIVSGKLPLTYPVQQILGDRKTAVPYLKLSKTWNKVAIKIPAIERTEREEASLGKPHQTRPFEGGIPARKRLRWIIVFNRRLSTSQIE
jgi:hypothetical protein